ncbi:hypothetical protein OQA88_7333 [Cercophora sp. LCS_1]
MATQQNQKRPGTDGPQAHRPRKKPRLPNFPPEFWDDLPKVSLTTRALRELDRRNKARPALKPPVPAVYTKDLAQFASRGGPGLDHLRGYPEPGDGASSSGSTMPTRTSRAKGSSAYSDNFERHLIEHNIYPEGYEREDGRQTPEPGNIDEVRSELLASRASLSPSRFPESAFRDFRRKNRTESEATVMRKVIPIITGDDDSIPNEGGLPFTNFKSMTGNRTVKPVPDFFDGNVDMSVRDDLSETIVPTAHFGAPVAPNFFLEVKAPGGSAIVVRRRACYDGAHGARAMHSLQNYGEEEPMYDGNAYAYSSTYHAGTGTLQLYAHHVRAPTDPEGQPEYHMTQVKSYALTSDLETCVASIKAFRNVRDLAQRHRNESIQGANARARRSDVEPEAAGVQQDRDSSSDEVLDSEEDVASEPSTQSEGDRAWHSSNPILRPRDLASAPRRSARLAASPNRAAGRNRRGRNLE